MCYLSLHVLLFELYGGDESSCIIHIMQLTVASIEVSDLNARLMLSTYVSCSAIMSVILDEI